MPPFLQQHGITSPRRLRVDIDKTQAANYDECDIERRHRGRDRQLRNAAELSR